MDSEVEYAQRPTSVKKLRACRNCKLIKTYEQFYTSFCENCPHSRPEEETAGRREDYVLSETTEDFEGMVAMMQPDKSWVARWLRMQVPGEDERPISVKPGLYAIMLIGEEQGAAAGREDEEGAAEDAYQEDEEDEEMDAEHKQVLANILGGGAASSVDREDPAQRDAAIDSQAIAQDEDNDV